MAEMRCPFSGHGAATTPASATTNQHWWPEQINLALLHQHHPAANPLGSNFDYRQAFSSLDLNAVKADLLALMTDSQSWWPADWGHYGGLFIRMAWHSAGTYRLADGRGGAGHGNQRFAPLNSWPDNTNLDKARRLLWPIKAKYGSNLSWADLIILAGNCALESMGLPTAGFAGGREDIWEPEDDIYWGRETSWLNDVRHDDDGAIESPLAATEMGLIYVNPEGPHGEPDPVASGREVRDTFARMGMNNEETVALVAGGHTFGKAHGAAPSAHLGADPEGAGLEQQGLGWHNTYASGCGADTITSGIEGAWKPNPTRWDQGYFEMLFGYEWELHKSPAGAWQWHPKDVKAEHMIPDAHVPGRSAPPMMTTADLSLRFDPVYEPIARRFLGDPQAFGDAFAQAWFKLTHRDLGPRSCYLGVDVPEAVQSWQDPLPTPSSPTIDASAADALKRELLSAGLSHGELISTAWASASSFRQSDRRGGANGARLRLQPQCSWELNNPGQLKRVLSVLEAVQQRFNQQHQGGMQVSLADLIVLGGSAAVEQAMAAAGQNCHVRFTPGRVDASADQTDTASFNALKPIADGFRNYLRSDLPLKAEQLLVDRAQQLKLSAPEMTALIGGFRVLGLNWDGSDIGVLTSRPGQFSNDFFVNLLDMSTQWSPVEGHSNLYQGVDSETKQPRWRASRVDLVVGSHAQLRAIAEVYGQAGGTARLATDFSAAWSKVMELDRFELH